MQQPMAQDTFTITPKGPFSLVASRSFLQGFTPATYKGAEQDDHLHMAFVVDGAEQTAGVCLREEDGVVVGEVYGAAAVDTQAVRRQVERILSLDVDGSRFLQVGERDSVVGRLQARYPGLRPVCFYSSYEAAAWALISQRIRIVQAARIKAHIAEELGETVNIHGTMQPAFPGPVRLRQLEQFPGLNERKITYLHAIAEATMEGKLDATRLRSLPTEQALEELRQLPGIGAFSSEFILLRGAGEPDLPPHHEPRLGRAVALAYGLKSEPTEEEMQTITENWRPFRTWITFLMRHMLEDETHEIANASR